MDDARQAHQRRVVRQPFRHELLEGASVGRVLVRVPGPGSVEPDRAFAVLDGGDLLALDEQDLRVRVQESPDQPSGRRPVDANVFSRDPFHGRCSCPGECDGRKNAAQSVPATPSEPAVQNVREGRIIHSAPPSAAAPATAKPRIA